jgi:4'-phosphopantetheinyl transferase
MTIPITQFNSFSVSRPPALNRGESHLWCISIQSIQDRYPLYWEWLDSEERARASRFHFDKDRERFVLSHGMLRFLLGHYLGQNPSDVTWQVYEQGKPYIKNHALQFNLSHSGDLILVGCCLDEPLGVDVEHERHIDDPLSIAKRFFHPKEYHGLSSLPASETLSHFYRVWSCKEAVVKLLGCGIADQLQHFCIKGGQDSKITVEWDKEISHDISLTALSPAPGYHVSIALSTVSSIQLFQELPLVVA